MMDTYIQHVRAWAVGNRIVLLFAVMGFVPIGCLAAALFDILPLYLTVRWVVLPTTAWTTGMALWWRDAGKRAGAGLVAGMVATLVYDTVRGACVVYGLWGDFIPVIGQLALNDPAASPLWGYGYRYLYDGGAMGMTFAMLPWWRSWRSGLVFGVGICCCLFGTLLLAPRGQELLFVLTPTTAAVALVGHMIYGSMLGCLLSTYRSKVVGAIPGRSSPTVLVAHPTMQDVSRSWRNIVERS